MAAGMTMSSLPLTVALHRRGSWPQPILSSQRPCSASWQTSVVAGERQCQREVQSQRGAAYTHLMLSERAQNGLMSEVLNVLGVEEGRGGRRPLVGSLDMARLLRMNALEDTQSTEIREGNLELLERLVARDEVLGRTGLSTLLETCHCCVWTMRWW